MVKCTFCGNPLPEGRGKMHVKNDGRILYFCASKCQKNHALKREGVKTRWTALYANKKGKK
jgi:large subunit ribosomal protein L24e